MSIWISTRVVGVDENTEDGEPRGGHVLSYADGFSNHHPDLTGSHERPASVDIASIAPWCVPGHNQDLGFRCTGCGADHDDPETGPFVRLTVYAPQALSFWGSPTQEPTVTPVHGSVVLDEGAARQLAADLLEWADSPKVQVIAP